MNEIIRFENADVKIITNETEPLFELYSVGVALGYVREIKGHLYPRQDRIDKIVFNAEIKPVDHRGQLYLTETQVYDFMLEARTDKCKKFRKWLTNEVVPAIRKHGSYSLTTKTKQDSYLIEDPAARARRWAEEYEERKALETTLEEQKPLVDFAEQVSDTADLIDVGMLSKLLKKEGINIGRNKLFNWLRINKYLRDNNEPYQRYINSGLFKTKEYTYYDKEDEPHVGIKTYVTGKGQRYLFNKLCTLEE